MNEDQKTCPHSFGRFSIAMIGWRWQCVKCDLIAPACFTPVMEARADFDDLSFIDDHIEIVRID